MAYNNRIYSDEEFSSKLLYNRRSKTKIRKTKFSDYCRALCKESLITGFPVIASTKGFVRRIVKILVFILSTCGFLYQTSEFLNIYRAYPTMVDIKVENPDVVPLPAITICNKNRIRRKEFCLRRRKECSWSNNRTQFCWANPKYCVPWQSDEETVFAVLTFERLSHPTRTLEDLDMFGLKRSDMLEICMVITETNKVPCKNYLSIIATDENGFPNNCFAIESLWGKPDAEEEQIPITGQIAMMLKMKPEEYLAYYDLVLAHIFMHDGHSLGNPMKEGLTLEAGMSHSIFVNKRITTRLPFPYKTNCTDYLKLWKENGGHGPLTEKACEDKCKMEEMLKDLGCVGQSIAYPNNNSVCSDGSKFPTLEILEKCSEQCNEACEEVSYSLRTEVKFDQAEKCGKDANCKKKDLILYFIFNRMEIERFVHEAKYESVEMFSYIGGYMGMWLGISLVSLFDLLETLICLSIYPFRNNKKNKKQSITRNV